MDCISYPVIIVRNKRNCFDLCMTHWWWEKGRDHCWNIQSVPCSDTVETRITYIYKRSRGSTKILWDNNQTFDTLRVAWRRLRRMSLTSVSRSRQAKDWHWTVSLVLVDSDNFDCCRRIILRLTGKTINSQYTILTINCKKIAIKIPAHVIYCCRNEVGYCLWNGQEI